ncbi:hypothetical protein FISHEDRAFT_60610 [Fistulina hepatica ATCC 64428]|uniref:Actin-like ATPase domain-containing protein n=1 Tax=Fistulina hepatica ATCC 64428 TaxID=1128425 RepID=A0A0D7A5X7_9AGAR|nr:hypothetical protein FISHEDRAFT_60610 [Fistulina hepatica ATCC 64428]
MACSRPYTGSQENIILSFDIGGRLFSSRWSRQAGIVLFSIVVPHLRPEVKNVERYPGQTRDSSVVPTRLLYDIDGRLQAAGAQTSNPDVIRRTRNAAWTPAYRFVEHLYTPSEFYWATITRNIPPLPNGKDLKTVLADLLRYLVDCTYQYICNTERNGYRVWGRCAQRMIYVFSFPGVWTDKRRDTFASAAIAANLVSNKREDSNRLFFYTESEAAIYYCMDHGLASHVIKPCRAIVVLDVGGNTTKITIHTTMTPNRTLKEVVPMQSVFIPDVPYGSNDVSTLAHKYFENLLRPSQFSSRIDRAVQLFDQLVKGSFGSNERDYELPIGEANEEDATVGVHAGCLRLEGPVVESFFKPVISQIVRALQDQASKCIERNMTVFLVGGFAVADYLLRSLQKHEVRTLLGAEVFRPYDAPCAIAHGSLLRHLDPRYFLSVAEYTYGIEYNTRYNCNDPEHRKRGASVYKEVDGVPRLPHVFAPIVRQNEDISQGRQFRRPFTKAAKDKVALRSLSVEIMVYKGTASVVPKWMDTCPVNSERETRPAAMFPIVCTVTANTSGLASSLSPIYGREGRLYYRIDVEVLLYLTPHGGAAEICWKEQGNGGCKA